MNELISGNLKKGHEVVVVIVQPSSLRSFKALARALSKLQRTYNRQARLKPTSTRFTFMTSQVVLILPQAKSW